MSFTFTARHTVDVIDVVGVCGSDCVVGGGGGGGGGLLMVDHVQIPVV